MATHKVRTVFQPNKIVEVSDAELTDLQRQKAVKEVVSDEPRPAANVDTSAASTPKKK